MEIKETAYKASGYYGKFKAISGIIIGIILIVVGIILVITSGSFNALIVSLFGLLIIIYGIILWKRCKSLIRGRFR